MDETVGLDRCMVGLVGIAPTDVVEVLFGLVDKASGVFFWVVLYISSVEG